RDVAARAGPARPIRTPTTRISAAPMERMARQRRRARRSGTTARAATAQDGDGLPTGTCVEDAGNQLAMARRRVRRYVPMALLLDGDRADRVRTAGLADTCPNDIQT